MKKILVLLLAAALCLSLAACAQSAAPAEAPTEAASEAPETEAAVETEAPAEETAEAASDEAEAQTEMEYISPDGWVVRYDPQLVESVEGDGVVEFRCLDNPENKASIRKIEGKQPEEVLGEICADWEADMEQIERSEGYFPGTEDKWAYWRVMEPQENGLSRTAIAGEFNGGVLLVENAITLTGDDEADERIVGALETVVDSLRFDRFDAQTMYSYYPGTYEAEQDGAVYKVVLNEDHSGLLQFQDEVAIIWSSIELIAEDGSFRYEYTIEGDSLLVNYDGNWLSFERAE